MTGHDEGVPRSGRADRNGNDEGLPRLTAEKDVPLRDRVRIAQRAASQWGRENDDAQYVSEVLADVADYLRYLDSRCDIHRDQPKACYLCL